MSVRVIWVIALHLKLKPWVSSVASLTSCVPQLLVTFQSHSFHRLQFSVEGMRIILAQWNHSDNFPGVLWMYADQFVLYTKSHLVLSALYHCLRENFTPKSHCDCERNKKFWFQGHFNVKEKYQQDCQWTSLFYISSTTLHDSTSIYYFPGKLVTFHSLQYTVRINLHRQIIHHGKKFAAIILFYYFGKAKLSLCGNVVVSEESSLGNGFYQHPGLWEKCAGECCINLLCCQKMGKHGTYKTNSKKTKS